MFFAPIILNNYVLSSIYLANYNCVTPKLRQRVIEKGYRVKRKALFKLI